MCAQSQAQVDDSVQTAFAGVLTGSLAVALMVTATITSNSVAVLADMVGTVFEFLAVLFSWLALRKMSRKSAYTFGYGYGKLENVVSMAIAVLMFLSLIIVIFNAVSRLSAPKPIGGFGVWMMLFAYSAFTVINGCLFLRTRRVLHTQSSAVLDSQLRLFAVKTLTDIWLLVALGLGLALRHMPAALYIDPVTSLLVAASMFLGAYRIVRTNLGSLLDYTLEEDAQLRIMKVLSEFFDEYTGFHGMRSRRSGNRAFIELFLEFDGERRMADVQEVVNRMRARVEDAVPDSEVSIVPSDGARD